MTVEKSRVAGGRQCIIYLQLWLLPRRGRIHLVPRQLVPVSQTKEARHVLVYPHESCGALFP